MQKRTSIHVNHMGMHNTNGRSRRGGRPYFSKSADIAWSARVSKFQNLTRHRQFQGAGEPIMSKPVAAVVMLLAAVCASPVAAKTPPGTSVGVLTPT